MPAGVDDVAWTNSCMDIILDGMTKRLSSQSRFDDILLHSRFGITVPMINFDFYENNFLDLENNDSNCHLSSYFFLKREISSEVSVPKKKF